MRHACLVVVCGAISLGAASMESIHRRNCMAESGYQQARLVYGLHDTVGCDQFKSTLVSMRAVCDTTVATADTSERREWRDELTRIIAVTDSIRAERARNPLPVVDEISGGDKELLR